MNGTQVGSVAHTGSIATSTNPLQIGGDSIYGQHFVGLIDEVRVYNTALTAAQIQTDQATPITPTGPDTTPPVGPASLTATAVSGGEVDLSWPAATDNVGVTGYLVERCTGAGCSSFAQVATPTATSYKDTAVNAGTAYGYRVRATDAAGNLGSYSATATATTPAPDTTPPARPASLTATAVSAGEVDLSWPAATDNVGVTGYLVERCTGAGCSSFAQVATPTATSYKDTAVDAGTAYGYRVRATDAAGNLGSYSATATATTPAPTGPSGLVAAFGFDAGSGTSVADQSGAGNNGTAANTTWAASGKYGKALQFNSTRLVGDGSRCCFFASDDWDDAGGVGQSVDGERELARRDLQGQRQLLPRGHFEQRLQARRRSDRRRHATPTPTAAPRCRPTPGRTWPRPTTAAPCACT